MTATLYSQSEITRLLTMTKYVSPKDWESSHRLRHGDEGRGKRIKALPADVHERATFTLAVQFKYASDEYSLTLIGSLDGRDEVEVCRYDVQQGPHRSPKSCRPRYDIFPRQPHRHIHCVACVRHGTPKSWDDCAEPLPIDEGGDFSKVMERLRMRFFGDTNLDAYDPEVRRLFEPNDERLL